MWITVSHPIHFQHFKVSIGSSCTHQRRVECLSDHLHLLEPKEGCHSQRSYNSQSMAALHSSAGIGPGRGLSWLTLLEETWRALATTCRNSLSLRENWCLSVPNTVSSPRRFLHMSLGEREGGRVTTLAKLAFSSGHISDLLHREVLPPQQV